MNVVFWTLVVTALSTFVVESSFLALSSAKRVMAQGVGLPLDVKLVAYILLAVGYPADVLFNWTRGTFMFRELPKWGEWLFSDRVQRHVLESSGRNHRKAMEWARLLNASDEDHIALTPRGI